jgi:hypothetical protein
MMLAVLPMAGCAFSDKPVPCPVCYEDEWSREPFPGEAKQHIKPLTPESIKANGGVVPRMPSATSY